MAFVNLSAVETLFGSGVMTMILPPFVAKGRQYFLLPLRGPAETGCKKRQKKNSIATRWFYLPKGHVPFIIPRPESPAGGGIRGKLIISVLLESPVNEANPA
jgi:hypothetical protein